MKKKKEILCEYCGEPIIDKESVKYINAISVCEKCFYHLKIKNGNLIRNSEGNCKHGFWKI